MVTGFVDGISTGAVYVAPLVPDEAIVPTEALPPAIPLTSQATLEPVGKQKDAVKA